MVNERASNGLVIQPMFSPFGRSMIRMMGSGFLTHRPRRLIHFTRMTKPLENKLREHESTSTLMARIEKIEKDKNTKIKIAHDDEAVQLIPDLARAVYRQEFKTVAVKDLDNPKTIIDAAHELSHAHDHLSGEDLDPKKSDLTPVIHSEVKADDKHSEVASELFHKGIISKDILDRYQSMDRERLNSNVRYYLTKVEKKACSHEEAEAYIRDHNLEQLLLKKPASPE